MNKSSFEVCFWGLPWKLQRTSSQGCFGSSFPKTPPFPVSEMNFQIVSEMQFFLVLYVVSHINRFQLFSGTCQTTKHASDTVERPKLRRLDASGRRRNRRRHGDGGRAG